LVCFFSALPDVSSLNRILYTDDAFRGHLSKDKVTKQPKLICRNWECGVVFPVSDEGMAGYRGVEGPGIEVFKGGVPVPMVVPGKEYGGRKPWFFKEGR
jgi:hypothetical protein